MKHEQDLFLEMGSIFHDAREYFDEQFKAFDLTRPEWLILAMLRNHQGEITQLFAKTYIGVETSYFTKILNKLENRGFIIREIDKNDRRNRIIKVNPKPPRSLKTIIKAIYDLNKCIQGGLNTKQSQNLYSALANIRKELENYKQQ